MTEDAFHTGACHCESVKFTILTPRDVEVYECNCSMCSMKGYLGLEIPASSLKSLEGKENLTEYSFNTKTAKHWFCRTCGICPLYVPRSNPDGYSINFRCLKEGTIRSHRTVKADGLNWELSHLGK